MPINLLARFSGDTSPMNRALASFKGDANKHGDTAGKAFGTQFKSAVLRFIGAGAIISQVQRQMQAAVKIESDAMREGLGVEAMQELQRAAEATGLTVDELREAAPEVAEAFTKMMTAIQSSGGILDKETVNTLADAAQELKKFSNDLAPLVSVLVKLFGGLNKAVKTGVAQIASNVYGALGSATGSELLKTQSQIASEDADRIWSEPIGAPAGQREAVGGFMSARREAIAMRAATAGSLAEALPKAGASLESAQGMVPFGGEAIKEMVAELKKSNTKLEAVQRSIEAAL